MNNSPPGKDLCRHNSSPERVRHEFRISDEMSFVYAPEEGDGKTAGMDKGLFLSFRGRVCSGGSAGFGLPVFRTDHQTFFPTLKSLVCTGDRGGELVFSMDRALFWHIAGRRAPARLTRVSEHLVDLFMRQSACRQARLLRIHDFILSLCTAEGRILPVQGIGCCRVFFQISGPEVHFRVDGSSLKERGVLTTLNEVDGVSFDTLRSRGTLRQGAGVPAWEETGFDAEIGSRDLGIGISLSPEGEDRSCCRLFCGREVSRGLNWAGLALTDGHPATTYRLHVHRRG